jgi:hypothetical protein
MDLRQPAAGVCRRLHTKTISHEAAGAEDELADPESARWLRAIYRLTNTNVPTHGQEVYNNAFFDGKRRVWEQLCQLSFQTAHKLGSMCWAGVSMRNNQTDEPLQL